MKNEVKRDYAVIEDITKKLNKLIEVYAHSEGLLPYLTHWQLDDADGKLTLNHINITNVCKESAENNVRNFYKMLSSFVSDLELEHFLAARFFPDYFIMLNIFNSLLYSMPRDIQKSDLEHLNHLYKKYNVKF